MKIRGEVTLSFIERSSRGSDNVVTRPPHRSTSALGSIWLIKSIASHRASLSHSNFPITSWQLQLQRRQYRGRMKMPLINFSLAAVESIKPNTSLFNLGFASPRETSHLLLQCTTCIISIVITFNKFQLVRSTRKCRRIYSLNNKSIVNRATIKFSVT